MLKYIRTSLDALRNILSHQGSVTYAVRFPDTEF